MSTGGHNPPCTLYIARKVHANKIQTIETYTLESWFKLINNNDKLYSKALSFLKKSLEYPNK